MKPADKKERIFVGERESKIIWSWENYNGNLIFKRTCIVGNYSGKYKY